MNEIIELNNNEEILEKTSNTMVDVANTLVDVLEIIEKADTPEIRIAKKMMDTLQQNLLETNNEVLRAVCGNKRDERNEHLDNLRGYFNEETGTWYEQICANFHQLTGFPANKWTALTWTVHLSLGHSIRDYLVHDGYINKIGDKYLSLNRKCSEEEAKIFGYDLERIKQLEQNNFEELA